MSRRARAVGIWTILTVLIAGVPGLGLALAAPHQQIGSELEVEHYLLENGLEVILVENHAAPTVAVSVWYRVGGADDPPGRSGFAHLFEHMMFQGSVNVARGQHDELVSAAGGIYNASTGIDRTNYYEAVPAHQLPVVLWLEADRMRGLPLDEANFDRERQVVKEEYRQRIQNQPYGEALLLLQTVPYDYVPYQRPPIGSIEDLDAATVEDVRAFHADYYKPNNAVITVAGDFDVAQTRAMIEQYFGDIPRQADPPQLPVYTFAAQTEARELRVADPLARVPATLIAYRTPPRSHPDSYATEVLARVLGVGTSSRLAEALLDTGLAAAAETQTLGNRGPSLFLAVLIPNPTESSARLEEVYYELLAQIQAEGVQADELEKVVNQIRSETVQGLQSSAELAEAVQAANLYYGDPRALFDELDRYRAVTSADVQRVAQTYLTLQSRNVIYVEPTQGGAR